MTKTDIDENEFHDNFQKIAEAVDIGFESNQAAKQKWLTVLNKIETDKINDLAEYSQSFRQLAEVIKSKEARTVAVCCCFVCCLPIIHGILHQCGCEY